MQKDLGDNNKMKMNKDAYIEIIKEDIVWLRKQPRTCEREHIEIVLNNSIQFNYPEKNEWLMDKSVVELFKNSIISQAGMPPYKYGQTVLLPISLLHSVMRIAKKFFEVEVVQEKKNKWGDGTG